MESIPVAVVGASGYAGAELLRLLVDHPHVDLVHLAAHKHAGQRVGDLFPHLLGRLNLVCHRFDPDETARAAKVVFLAPLLEAHLIKPEGIIVDAKSGVSGAGRTPTQATHFSEAGEGVRAYKVAEHRHTPEIEQELSRAAGTRVLITFTPHLLPMSRGI